MSKDTGKGRGLMVYLQSTKSNPPQNLPSLNSCVLFFGHFLSTPPLKNQKPVGRVAYAFYGASQTYVSDFLGGWGGWRG